MLFVITADSRAHLDKHTGLVVGIGGEGLRLFGGDGGVALDQSRHHATCREVKRMGSSDSVLIRRSKIICFWGARQKRNTCDAMF